MKAANFNEAYSIFQAMKSLQHQRLIVVDGNGLGVTIQSTYQETALVDAIRPHVVAELDRRIAEKKAILSEMGITFDEAAQEGN